MSWKRSLLKVTGTIWRVIILAGLIAGRAVVPGAAVSTPAAGNGTQLSAAGIPGIAWTGGMGVRETSAQIMVRQALQNGQMLPPSQAFFNGKVNFSARTANPASSGLVQVPSISLLSGAQVTSTADLFLPNTVNFDGPDYTANPCGTPPDTMGAVGPTQFIIAVNCKIVSYNKANGTPDGVLNTSPAVFFTSVSGGAGNGVSDPHIRYDRTSGRWFIVMINTNFPDNRIMLAVSSAGTIVNSTTWTFFFFQDSIGGHANCLGDYPTPGIDTNAIYIGVNQFCGASLNSATYLTSDAFVVQKSSVLGAGPIHVTAFPTLVNSTTFVGPFTPQGVDNPDPAATEGYFIGADGAQFGILDLRRVSNPGGATPTLSGNVQIPTALQATPITQPHLGNTSGANGQLDASDGRLFAATLRNGSLWTALDSGVNSACSASNNPTRDAVFWYELTGIASGSTPTVHQAGAVCDTAASSPAFYSYGTVMVNGQGHAAVGFTIAGASNFTTPGVASRLAGDPLNALQAVNVLVAGSHSYNPVFDPGATSGRRWGDYSFTSLDPCDDMTLWTVQEYASANNIYGMRVAKLLAPPPAQPTTAGTIPTGQASVNVTITGTSTSGSGFYDTPANLTDACRTRLQAAVSGGVTVNSVTFTDATHITLNLSTVGATPGLQNVAITNPDGQSATGTGILNVTSAAATSLALSSSLNPSTFGQAVQLTATVTSAGGIPSGSVTFTDGATSLGTVALSSGSASLSTAALATGVHTISASYAGNASFAPSGGTLAGGQTVNPAPTTVLLTSSANPALVGFPVTFTVTVSSSPGLVAPGSISLMIDGVPTISPLNASGVAVLTTSALATGSHAISATYPGSANFAASLPANLVQSVRLPVFVPVIFK